MLTTFSQVVNELNRERTYFLQALPAPGKTHCSSTDVKAHSRASLLQKHSLDEGNLAHHSALTGPLPPWNPSSFVIKLAQV